MPSPSRFKTRTRLLSVGLATLLLAGQADFAAAMTIDNAGAQLSVGVTTWRDIPFRTVVRQQYDYSCGSAAIATLLRHHYGRPVAEAEVFKAMWEIGDQAYIRRSGFSMLDMKRYLAMQGLTADGYRLGLDELAQDRTPAIVLIDLGRYRHFVVIKGVRPDRVLVGDPALGLRVFPRKQFEKIWNGIVLVIHDTPAGPAPSFDQPSDWRPRPGAPIHSDRGAVSPAELTRALAPTFQFTPFTPPGTPISAPPAI